MTQPSLDQEKLAQLEKLAELAKATAEKIRIFNLESEKMAEKWQQKAEKQLKNKI